MADLSVAYRSHKLVPDLEAMTTEYSYAPPPKMQQQQIMPQDVVMPQQNDVAKPPRNVSTPLNKLPQREEKIPASNPRELLKFSTPPQPAAPPTVPTPMGRPLPETVYNNVSQHFMNNAAAQHFMNAADAGWTMTPQPAARVPQHANTNNVAASKRFSAQHVNKHTALMMTFVVVTALGIHSLVEKLLGNYVTSLDWSPDKEMLLRVSYPLVAIVALWAASRLR